VWILVLVQLLCCRRWEVLLFLLLRVQKGLRVEAEDRLKEVEVEDLLREVEVEEPLKGVEVEGRLMVEEEEGILWEEVELLVPRLQAVVEG